MSTSSRIVRIMFAEGDRARDKGLQTPEDVIRYDDIQYDTQSPLQILDVYRPREKEGDKLPVIMIVHGGGWVYGTKETYQFYGMSLAQRGFAVVNYSYRLAPEDKFPACYEDTNRVAGWILEKADLYGFDTDRIFAVGDSAGGMILAGYAGILTNPDFAALFDFKTPENFRLRGAALNCASLTLKKGGGSKLARELILKDLLPDHGSEKEYRQLNVIPYLTKDYIPIYLAAANKDQVIPIEESQVFSEKLTELGIDHVFKVYGTDQAPMGHVFHCNVRLAEGKECNDDECAFFKQHCTEI